MSDTATETSTNASDALSALADTESAPSASAPDASSLVYSMTWGCQMNVLDTELALSAMQPLGLNRSDDMGKAGVVVVNTCSVRDLAEQKAYSFLGRLKQKKRQNPELVIVVAGCMAQKEGELIFRRAPYVDIVAGTRHFTKIGEYVREAQAKRQRILALDRDEQVRSEMRAPSIREDQHSAFIAVMRGCDHHCTYCVVPNTRGIESSKPFEDVVKEAEILVGDGVTEITLLGQNIDSYGKRLTPRRHLHELIRAVGAIPGLKRLRFITSHPADIRPELIDCFREGEVPALMPYFHFPAQSGSDEVLKRMRRGYTQARYLDIVERVREARPDIGIAGDTIVGFCGETEADFEQTMELHRRTRFQQCYMFTYSERAYTPAIQQGLPDDVPQEVKAERHARLLQLQREICASVYAEQVGKSFEVLVEGPSKSDPEVWVGRNPQNQVVHFRAGREGLKGSYVQVRVDKATDLALYGVLE